MYIVSQLLWEVSGWSLLLHVYRVCNVTTRMILFLLYSICDLIELALTHRQNARMNKKGKTAFEVDGRI